MTSAHTSNHLHHCQPSPPPLPPPNNMLSNDQCTHEQPPPPLPSIHDYEACTTDLWTRRATNAVQSLEHHRIPSEGSCLLLPCFCEGGVTRVDCFLTALVPQHVVLRLPVTYQVYLVTCVVACVKEGGSGQARMTSFFCSISLFFQLDLDIRYNSHALHMFAARDRIRSGTKGCLRSKEQCSQPR